MHFSDHHPITITLTLHSALRRYKIWGYNHSLLKDLTFLADVTQDIRSYINANISDDTFPIIQLEHKSVLLEEN